MAQALKIETRSLVDPVDYANHGYPHDIWTRLRAEEPVSWWEQKVGVPFWAVTKHADIVAIGKQPETFLNGPRLVITPDPDNRNDQFADVDQLDPPSTASTAAREQALHAAVSQEDERRHRADRPGVALVAESE